MKNAISANQTLEAFVFFTNINLTLGEKEALINSAKSSKIHHCEIFDRERLRISLDSPDGFSIRFQYLDIPLSEPEQASFFARWGDDIQQVISTGFKNIENGINRLLFLEESQNPLHHFSIALELKEKYTAKEIGHFRAFCSLHLKEIKKNIFEIDFGSSDKAHRIRLDNKKYLNTTDLPGIEHGISSGQWEYHIDLDKENSAEEDEKYILVGSSSSIGQDSIEFITISYQKDAFIRFSPTISLKDFDEALFMPIINKSLAEKIKSFHIYSDGYKIQEINFDEFEIDEKNFNPKLPIEFSDIELGDPWVRIRPSNFASTFTISFFDKTPKRMHSPEQVENSLEQRYKNSNTK